MGDDDLAMALPQPPQPNPARRAAAIGSALARFDAGGSAARSTTRVERGWWGTLRNRPQIAGLAAVAITAVMVVAPVAWRSSHDRPLQSATTARADAAPPPGVAVGEAPVPPPSELTQSEAPPAVVEADAALDTGLPGPAASRSAARCGGVPCEPGPNAPDLSAPSAPETMSAAHEASSKSAGPGAAYSMAARMPQVGRETRFAAPAVAFAAPPAPPPPAAPPPERLAQAAIAPPAPLADSDADAASSIVVTASRRTRGAADRRGDWNACTVDDPGHSLSGCRGLINPGAAGAGGRAAAQIADGLALAWQDDLDAAIAKFDLAIEIAPRSAFAYLNRGLAYRRKGDTDRALDDLNKAVRYAPAAARGYYHRSLLYRERGDEGSARRDAQQAADLDDRYRDLAQ